MPLTPEPPVVPTLISLPGGNGEMTPDWMQAGIAVTDPAEVEKAGIAAPDPGSDLPSTDVSGGIGKPAPESPPPPSPPERICPAIQDLIKLLPGKPAAVGLES